MSKLNLYDAKGSAVGELEFPEALLVTGKGEQAVHDAVVAHLAGLRAGTASTLRKGEVAGSGKKPWRQKGTGRARAGYRQSPVWRGGGVAFGPHPRDYGVKIPRKVARLAFRRAFSEKVQAGEVKVIDGLSLHEPKTKLLLQVLRALGVGEKALVVVPKIERNQVLAARNLPGVELTTAREVSTFQLLRYPVLVLTREAVEQIQGRMESGRGGAA